MKEVLSKNFWRDVKRSFDEGREGLPAVAAADAAALRAILFDMDGVVYDAGRLIPGAVETIGWLRSEQIPHLFVTNTTSRSRTDLTQKLAGFGISDASPSEILNPIAAVAQWLRTDAKGDIAAFVRPSARDDFAGLPLLPDDAERGAAYVVIGDLGHLWDYRTLNRAFRLLHHNPDAKLIALGMTRYWMAEDGIALDVAPFVVALAHAARRDPLVFGKPSAAFFRAAADQLRLLPAEILMIGDDIEADVGGAQAAGMRGALVKTGKFRSSDLGNAIHPHFVLDSIADVPRLWASTRILPRS
jgi:phospholysine phosphohistidine inorganic pyrophosphate phosphatase